MNHQQMFGLMLIAIGITLMVAGFTIALTSDSFPMTECSAAAVVQ